MGLFTFANKLNTDMDFEYFFSTPNRKRSDVYRVMASEDDTVFTWKNSQYTLSKAGDFKVFIVYFTSL